MGEADDNMEDEGCKHGGNDDLDDDDCEDADAEDAADAVLILPGFCS